MGKGIDFHHLDTTSDPGKDFYRFVNGGWLDTTQIPADRSSWGSFHELSKSTDDKVLQILQDELSTLGSSHNKAARLFETGMDIPGIEKHRLSAIAPFLEKIRKLESLEQLPDLAGKFCAAGIPAFLFISIHPDLANSKVYAPYLEPAPLGLPEKEYYQESGEKAENIRHQYKKYISTMLVKGVTYTPEKADKAAGEILLFETEMADHLMSKEERRQIDKIYNPVSTATLKEMMGRGYWNKFLEKTQASDNQQIIITDPAFITWFCSREHQMSLDLIKTYLEFMLIHGAAPFAHQELEEAHFNFYSKALDGVEVMRPRQERVVKVVNTRLGEMLGQLFVEKHFPPEAKATALEMTGDIVAAYANRIKNLAWMGDQTKAYALEKLEAFKVKIGYPDKWKDFSALTITGPDEGGHYLENMLRITAWKQKEDLGKTGQPVDREEWFMAPQIVNAYYNSLFNEIVFPAAILQPPFFDWEADAAVNYGGIGAVIGHEITHGFDDQGSRFDKEGNFKEWWTTNDREQFDTITRKLIEQFDAYFPFEDLPLNGTFTLGENIADLGGLCVAYDALQLYYQRHGRPGLIDGFTPDQRFFMSWATVWRTKIRDEALRHQIKTDPHPPGYYRAVAAPSNMDHFYNAFPIAPDNSWYRTPESRISIW